MSDSLDPTASRPQLVAGRRALVTGGSRGLGAGAALALAEAGADVAILYRKRAEEADAVAERCAAFGVRAVTVQADVADSAETTRAVEEAALALGGLDIVVANAGIPNPHLALADTPDERWHKIVSVNLDGAFHTVRAAVPHLVASPAGAVVFVSTIGSLRAAPNQATYATSKAAVNELARCWAIELAPHGVRVNAIAPGIFVTDMTEILRTNLGPEAIDAMVPLGRPGDPLEFGRFVTMLCSDYASYVTGEVIRVDGGMSA